VAVVVGAVEVVEVAMQEQALENREVTSPVQAAPAYVGIAVFVVIVCAMEVAQKD
jgi:hypothetical protein